jgi:branched-chain amino acid transport system substrate-binding protein
MVGSRSHAASTRKLGLALVSALALSSVGCGARWDAAQTEEIAARYASRGGSTGAATGGTSTSPTAAGGSSATTTPGGAPAAAGGSATGAGAPSASGDAAAVDAGGAGGPAPCSAPSDAPGVTDTTIILGTITTQSGPVPGLGNSALAAVRAYAAHRNSLGGVCGRQLEVQSADDGFDNARYRSILTEFASSTLAIAGGVASGDAGGVDIIDGLGIPLVSTPISAALSPHPTVFSVNPPFADVNRSVPKYDYLSPQGVRTAALVYLAADQTRSEIQGKQRPQLEAAGIEVVHQQELPISTFSFDSAARAVVNSGADYLLFVADGSLDASMARSLADAGADLMFAEYLVAYGTGFIDLAGSAAEGATSWIRTLPNEDGGANPEQATFLTWMDQTAPGEVVDTFAADSWSSAKALVDALAALPGPITREALIAQLQTVTNYDADGFIGPIDLGGEQNRGCVIGMIVEGGAWRRLTPADGFLC